MFDAVQYEQYRFKALAWDIVLCSWVRHFSLTMHLSTDLGDQWVPANLMLGITLGWTSIPSRG